MALESLSEAKISDGLPDDQEISKEPKIRRLIRNLGWLGFFVALLLLFTISKLPEQRLKNFIQGNVSSVLAPRGISMNAASSSISVLFGLSYRMKDVTIHLPPPDAPVKVDEIEISPSLLSLLFGKFSGSIRIEQGSSYLKASASASGFATAPSKTPAKQEISVSFRAKDFNIGKIALLQILAGFKGAMTLNGDGSFSGEPSIPSSWSGDLNLDLSKITIDSQNLYGFNLPGLRVAEGKLAFKVASGKATINSFKLGKTGTPDDLIATVTGEILLGRSLDSSNLNLKARFSLSQTILKSLSLLDMIMGQAKQSDGSYAYGFSGPITAPAVQPGAL